MLCLFIKNYLATLEQKGLKRLNVKQRQDVFNADNHEAVNSNPCTEQEDLKGKIVDVIEKGYFKLGDKVIRDTRKLLLVNIRFSNGERRLLREY